MLCISNKIKSPIRIFYQIPVGIYDINIEDWMELIYLHIYKDTYSIFMQVYEPTQYFYRKSKFQKKKEKYTL